MIEDGVRMLSIDDVDDILQAAIAPYEQARIERGQLSGLLDRLPYPVWRRDAAMAVTYCNQAHARLFGVGQAEVIAKGREISAAAKALAKRAQKLSLAQSESQQLVVDGIAGSMTSLKCRSWMERWSVMRWTRPRSRRAMRSLVRHIAAHDDVLQSLGNGIVIFGPDRRVKFFNTAYREQFSLDAAFLRGEPTLDQVLESLRERRQIAEQADFRSFKQEFIRHVMTLIEPFEDLMHTPGGAPSVWSRRRTPSAA